MKKMESRFKIQEMGTVVALGMILFGDCDIILQLAEKFGKPPSKFNPRCQ
jgi:hypothetical protein